MCLTKSPIRLKKVIAKKATQSGNTLFEEGKFAEANLAYTEALKVHGESAKLFVNRALCMLMLGEWNEVIADTKRAIDIESTNVKGHFFLGLAYMEQERFEEAINELREAKRLSERSNVLYSDDPIESAIRRAQYLRWQQRNQKRQNTRNQSDSCSGTVVLKGGHGEGDHMNEAEIPDYFSCHICIDLLQDPVITKLGITYCRKCISEMLHKVGHVDPITGVKIEEHELIPNIALRDAIEKYVEDNGWIFSSYE